MKLFLKSEVRYSSLMKENPEHGQTSGGGLAIRIWSAEQNAKWRLAGYKRMAAQQF